ncbi:MAG TPA: beta-ketoacyl synthase chain length factor [Chitinophagales bacterium]
MKAVYITGKGLISPVGSDLKNLNFAQDASTGSATSSFFLEAEKPDFGKYFDIKQARRTSKILRMAMVAAFDALGNDTQNINGVIVGTGIGCISDSEKFLVSLLQYKEEMLSPTSFIQSTHNTIAASIAMQLKLHEYNLTYSERIFSFEWALLDAMMQVNETPENTRFLVGSADELTEKTFQLGKALNLFRAFDANDADIVHKKHNAFFAGEHSAFFTLEKNDNTSTGSATNAVKLAFVKLFFERKKEDSFQEILAEIQATGIEKPDCILIGINGQEKYDNIYNEVENLFPKSNIAYFKHLCGESFTASSFAFWLATEMLEKNYLPENIVLKKQSSELKSVLILNHFRNDYLSATLLTI